MEPDSDASCLESLLEPTESCSGAGIWSGRFSEEQLLRLAQSNVSEIERAELSAPSPEVELRSVPKPDRRKAERRGMDALRDEALRNVISKVEDRNFGGLRTRVHWGRGMKPSRIVLLLVAVLAGGLAAFLAVQHEPARDS